MIATFGCRLSLNSSGTYSEAMAHTMTERAAWMGSGHPIYLTQVSK